MQRRLAALRERHAELERALEDERARACPDLDRIRRLKIDKLRLKDEMAMISTSEPPIHA